LWALPCLCSLVPRLIYFCYSLSFLQILQHLSEETSAEYHRQFYLNNPGIIMFIDLWETIISHTSWCLCKGSISQFSMPLGLSPKALLRSKIFYAKQFWWYLLVCLNLYICIHSSTFAGKNQQSTMWILHYLLLVNFCETEKSHFIVEIKFYKSNAATPFLFSISFFFKKNNNNNNNFLSFIYLYFK
jgi:hypothetical protein